MASKPPTRGLVSHPSAPRSASGRLMLDTNAASALVRACAPQLDATVMSRPHCVSVVTEAELLYGLARRPQAQAIAAAVRAFLAATEVLPWTSQVAAVYADTRAQLARAGQTLAALDLMIAAHALAEGCTLATQDQAFRQVPALPLFDWSGA